MTRYSTAAKACKKLFTFCLLPYSIQFIASESSLLPQETGNVLLPSSIEAQTGPSHIFRSRTFAGTIRPRIASLGSPYSTEARSWQSPVRHHSLPAGTLVGREQDGTAEDRIRQGRLARMLKNVGRWISRAKERLREVWKTGRSKAGAVKTRLRRAVAKLYSKLPRMPWHRRPPRRPSQAPYGMDRSASSPSTAPYSADDGDAEEASGISTKAGVERPEVPKEEQEEWYDAPEFREPEEFITPPSSPSLNFLRRQREAPRKQRGGSPEQEQLEFETIVESPTAAQTTQSQEGCTMGGTQVGSQLKGIVTMYPDLCILWLQFEHRGYLSSRQEDMPMLAAQLASKIMVAKELLPGDTDQASEVLRLTSRLAEAQQALVLQRQNADTVCWFISGQGIYRRANPAELEVMDQVSGSVLSFLANPSITVEKLRRLMESALAESPQCLDRFKKEVKLRSRMDRILEEGRTKLEEAMKLMPQEGYNAGGAIILRDLELLRGREACSMEAVYRNTGQVEEIRKFIVDYNQNGKSWWLAQWPFKLERCKRPPKGARSVPEHIAQRCRAFEAARPSLSPEEVAHEILWLWEIGDTRH